MCWELGQGSAGWFFSVYLLSIVGGIELADELVKRIQDSLYSYSYYGNLVGKLEDWARLGLHVFS